MNTKQHSTNREENQTPNPTITNPLERVAARALNAKREEAIRNQAAHFENALSQLPLELQLETRLVGVRTPNDMRLEIAGYPFDLETENKLHYLYHADLALLPAISELEDYAGERAQSTQRKRTRTLIRNLSAFAIISLLVFIGAFKLVNWLGGNPQGQAQNIANVLTMSSFMTIFAICGLLVVDLNETIRVLHRIIKKLTPLENPSAVTQAAFDAWRGSKHPKPSGQA